jgi:carboxyl-terminal processing protease
LEVDSESKLIRVITPVRGSPAHRAGVRAGDLLTHITLTTDKEGKRLAPARVISTRGMSVKAVNDKLLGRAGTRVQLTLRRASIAKPLQLEMERDSVFPDTVLGWRLKKDDTWDYWLDARNKIAYIRLTRFARRSHADLKETITNLRRQRMKGLVLDLRFNPGGLLTQAIEIADLFIKDGTIVSACDRSGRKRAFTGTAKGSLLDFPIVCLVNGESALSSELVSGCLQDHHRALIVGERSYGRGCVQNIQDFGRGQLKYTTAQFLRPCGKKLERTPVPGFPDADWGVIPDRGYVLKLPTRERTRLKDYLDSREYLIRRDRPVRDAFATFADRQRDRALTYLRERLGKPQNPGAGNDKKS